MAAKSRTQDFPMSAGGDLNSRIRAAEEALRRASNGLLTNLNALFYSKHGRSFVESLVRDPVLTYVDALKASSQGTVEAAIKIALRAMGLDPVSVERAVEALRRGDAVLANRLILSSLH